MSFRTPSQGLLPGMLEVMNALFRNNACVPAALSPETLLEKAPYDNFVLLEFSCEGPADVETSLNVNLEHFFDDCDESFFLDLFFRAMLSGV